MPLARDEIYIKSTDPDGLYTVVYNDREFKERDYVDVIAVIMHAESRKIHVFDPDYAIALQHFTLGDETAERYLWWLKRRANSL